MYRLQLHLIQGQLLQLKIEKNTSDYIEICTSCVTDNNKRSTEVCRIEDQPKSILLSEQVH